MADQPPDETPEKRDRYAAVAGVTGGFIAAAVAAFVTFGTAFAIMAPMSWAAIFVIGPLLAIAAVCWFLIVSVASRTNGYMWIGVILFALLPIGWIIALQIEDAYQKRSSIEAEVERISKLGPTLQTTRIVKAPVGRMKVAVISESRCPNGELCEYILISKFAEQIAEIDQSSVNFYKMASGSDCAQIPRALKFSVASKGFFTSCILKFREANTSLPLTVLEGAVVLLSGKTDWHPTMSESARSKSGITAHLVENGQLGSELARWEHLRADGAVRKYLEVSGLPAEYGTAFSILEFFDSLFGVPSAYPSGMIVRPFSEAINDLIPLSQQSNIDPAAVQAYFHSLLSYHRRKTGRPTRLSRETSEKLDRLIEILCEGVETSRIHGSCKERFDTLNQPYKLIRE